MVNLNKETVIGKLGKVKKIRNWRWKTAAEAFSQYENGERKRTINGNAKSENENLENGKFRKTKLRKAENVTPKNEKSWNGKSVKRKFGYWK